MHRVLIITLSLLYTCFSWAKTAYQIDLILFAQHPPAVSESGTRFIPMHHNAIQLKYGSSKIPTLYSLLPNSYSNLRDQHYLLSRRSPYPILGHYSWRQPANNHSKVALPLTEHNGWQIQGTFHIQQSNYYSFNTDLQVSVAGNPQSSFTITHKQRLKKQVMYYLDNEHIGMLVKIHPVG